MTELQLLFCFGNGSHSLCGAGNCYNVGFYSSRLGKLFKEGYVFVVDWKIYRGRKHV